MKTLNFIKNLMDEYVDAISSIDSKTEEEYKYRFNSIREHFAGLFKDLRDAYPELLQYNYNDVLPDDEADRIVNRITQNASKRYTVPFLPTGNVVVDRIMDDTFVTPTFVPWQCEGNRKQNFVIAYNDAMFNVAVSMQATLLQNMLMCFAPGKIHFNIFDFSMTGMSDAITTVYDSELYHGKVIMEANEASECIRHLRERMQIVMQKYGDLPRYNESHKNIELPYEVVVLNNYPEGYEQYTKQMQPLFENGRKSGIYFVVMHNTSAKKLESHYPDLLYSEAKTIIPFQNEPSLNGTMVQHSPLICNDSIMNAYHKHFVDELFGKDKEISQKVDISEVAMSPYAQTNSEIIAPIGRNSDGEIVNFKIDVNKGHYHTFIIGETGSGKSRFLHDIIINMISKYSPEDVELYLMDFKGVEFNPYRDIKHSRVVLVDRADERITYEVIYELKEKMQDRQRLLASSGASDVDEYNKKSKERHLSQIILVADECQTLFADRTRNSRLQNEMIDIIALIAQQGRAYGVHLLLATQSLSNAPQLGKDILNQIGEHFILPCLPADARRLVPDHEQRETENIVSKMEKGKGQCYYQGADGKFLFTYNYIAKGEEQTKLINLAIDKAKDCESNGQVYFSGSLKYPLTSGIVEHLATRGRRNMVVSPGQAIDLKQEPLSIGLKEESSENVLILGVNDKYYVTQTALGCLMTLIAVNKKKEIPCEYYVFDCYDDDEATYLDTLDAMNNIGLCKCVRKKDRLNALYNVCKDIANGTSGIHKVIVILGEELFREMKYNEALAINEIADRQQPKTDVNDLSSILAVMNSISNPVTSKKESNVEADISNIKTTCDAMRFILDKGPEHGVHTIMQIDKASHFYLDNDNGYLNIKSVYSRFRHLVLLRSNENDMTMLRLPDDVHPDRLEDNPDRLRAYYYNEGGDKFSLFTPYQAITTEQIHNILK